MQPKLAISFWQRGLPGLLSIALGLGLCLVFRHSSTWPAEAKHWAYWLAIPLAVGGGNLVGSYVWQKPWAAMRDELIASATIVACMLLR